MTSTNNTFSLPDAEQILSNELRLKKLHEKMQQSYPKIHPEINIDHKDFKPGSKRTAVNCSGLMNRQQFAASCCVCGEKTLFDYAQLNDEYKVCFTCRQDLLNS